MRFLVVGSLIVAVLLGLAGGLGGFTFWYARGASYLSNDPEACANCHIMRGQLDGWNRSSHKAAATCNDCHTPHDFAGKWLSKALNGYHHSLAFTTGEFHEPIQIKASNRQITESACRDCHSGIVQGIDPLGGAHGEERHVGLEPVACLHCHSGVGH